MYFYMCYHVLSRPGNIDSSTLFSTPHTLIFKHLSIIIFLHWLSFVMSRGAARDFGPHEKILHWATDLWPRYILARAIYFPPPANNSVLRGAPVSAGPLESS